jgi:hypothetical protein
LSLPERTRIQRRLPANRENDDGTAGCCTGTVLIDVIDLTEVPGALAAVDTARGG